MGPLCSSELAPVGPFSGPGKEEGPRLPGGGPEKRVLGCEPNDSVKAGKVLRLQSLQRLKIGAPKIPPVGVAWPACLTVLSDDLSPTCEMTPLNLNFQTPSVQLSCILELVSGCV